MLPSRTNHIVSSAYVKPRLMLCVLVVALCLLALPKRSAQTSANSFSAHRVASAPEASSPQLSTDGRIGNVSRVLVMTQLPEPHDATGASLSMARGDFDEDGVPDLVVGSGGARSFALSVYVGNPASVYPESPDARRSLSRSNDLRPLVPAKSFPLISAPDFLATGDFNDDGHLDVAAAARGGSAMYLLAGDGHGDFGPTQSVALTGKVTALGSRDLREFGGDSGLAVGIVDNTGPAVLLLKSLNGAALAKVVTFRSPAEVATIAFRRSNSSNAPQLLIAAGRELLVIPSDVSEGWDAAAGITQRSFSSVINSIVVGTFVGDHGSDVAVLTADGAVNVLAETPSGEIDWRGESVTLGFWPGSTSLIQARVSGSNADDLVIVDSSAHRLHTLIEETTTAGDSSRPPVRSRVSVSRNVEGEPLALLPMRLSEGALDDLVILRAGQLAPALFHVSVAMTFQVINTSDSGVGSLRQAILDANGNPGVDTINFNIAAAAPHTISLLSPLPPISEAVTINGASQPDFAGTPVIELNGINAGVADGLVINSASCVLRGLVINRFSGNGIVVSGNANIIEGNFIGTNATGTFALGNGQDGVSIAAGSGNTIGGTTSAARNVISGNRNGIQISGGSGTQVRGNFVGTNSAGTAGLGNSANGVLINNSGNAVGAVGSASSNTIAFNGGAGVAIASGTGNPIQSNSIFSNGGLGIDLAPAGVTPNDSGDGDSGANNLQNFPVLNSASSAGTSTTIEGTLNSTAGTAFRLEFFSNQAPNPSGFGEGQTFIGAINVTTGGTGNASFNPTFPVTVAPGQIITATANDPGNNTSEFSRSVQVGGVSGGTPADLSVLASIAPNPVETGSQVTNTIVVTNGGPATATSVTVTDVVSANTSFASCNSTGGGVCGGSGTNRTVTFASLAPGTSAVITIVATVNCSVSSGTVIGHTATVFSSSTPDANPSNNVATATTSANNPAPRIACPANVNQINDPGQCAAVVNYFVPPATDNCPIFNVICSPPSGSSFAIGTTTVNCVATDGGGLTASCSFTVTVSDFQRVAVSCPSNVSVTASAGQCSPVVNYPAPTVIDNCPGASVSCVPPSGSTFPLGVTSVVCTAVDAKGVQATCGFTVNVIGTPQAVVRLEGNGPALDFGPVPARRKIKKLKKQPARNFTVENTGCIQLVLTLDSIRRVGTDVDRGRISDPDDRELFTISLIDDAGAETTLDILTDVRIGAGQKQNFKIRFVPTIPAVANKTRGLAADQALPDLITSLLTFTQNGGAPIRINLVGHITTEVVLINPGNPRAGPLVVFSRVDDDFVIEYSIYDSDTTVNQAVYQFFNKKAQPVENPIKVDLAPLIQQTGFVTGQTFTIVQRISGARDHKDIVGVMVTISDADSTDSASSDPAASVASSPLFGTASFVAAKLSASPLSLPSSRHPDSSNGRALIDSAAIDRSRREK
jgi:uncharacterized repeat protein (TIGR01451 family)